MKRILSMLLAVVMVISMFPVVAFAQGTVDEPATVVVGANTAALNEDNDYTYFYTFTATAAGTFTISAEGAEVIDLRIGNDQPSGLSGEVKTGDVVTFGIYVKVNGDYTWSFDFEEADVAGSTADNPIDLTYEWIMNPAQTEGTCTVTVPTGITYFMSYAGAGMNLTINGGEPTLLQGMPRQPVYFQINNEGEAAVYTLKISLPVGTFNNPAQLSTVETNVATLKGDGQPYFFTWTAVEDGTLTIEMPKYVGWSYTINTPDYYGDEVNTGDANVDNVIVEVVYAGDVIEFIVNTYDAANPNSAPAGTLNIGASFEGLAGSQSNPINVVEYELLVWNDAYTEATAELWLWEGETMYYALPYSNMELYIDGELIGITTGNNYVPQVIAVTGVSDMEPVILKLATPAGDQSNPAVASLGINDASVAAGTQGYFWTYTAEYTGDLYVEIYSNDNNWVYVVNNMTTYAYGETQWSDSDPVVNPCIISVEAGDEIQIMVNGYDPENPYEAPAADLTVTLSYAEGDAPASAIALMELPATVTNAGTVYYQAMLAGQVMTISGEGEFSAIIEGETVVAVDGVIEATYPAQGMGRPMPSVFAIIGDGEFTVSAAYPVGHMENPATAWLTDNEVSIAADGQGYYFEYIADYTGNLIVTISGEENWMYAVHNLSTYNYSDTMWSDDEVVVNPYTVAVEEGDEIQIIVNGFDPENPWEAPAADLTVTLEYERGLAPELPIMLLEQEQTVTNSGTMYYEGYFAGQTVTISGLGEFSVIADGETIASTDGKVEMTYPKAMGRPMPNQFAIVGEGDFTITAEYPLGSRENPEWIYNPSQINTSIAAGNGEGYYYCLYNRMATAAFELTVNSVTEGVEVDVILTTSSSYAMNMLSESENNTVSIDMVPGDTVYVQVVTYPDNDWNYPAAEVAMSGRIVYPVGTRENPAPLSTTNAVAINEGNFEGYFFTWTAEVDGYLTIQMPLYKNWTYVVNNLTSYKYGENLYSDDADVLNPNTIAVKAGDELQVIVNTYDPANPYAPPADAYAFTAKFETAAAQVGDEVYTSLQDALNAAEAGQTVTLLNNVEVDGYVILPVGVNLNLGDYSLTADYVYGSKDSSILANPGVGKLIVPKGNLILGQGAKNEMGQYVLPIWDPANNCYMLSLFVVNTSNDKRGLRINDEKIYFQFKHQASEFAILDLLADGASDNEMSVIIRLEWTNEQGTANQEFVYNDSQIGYVSVGKDGSAQDYTFTLTGYSALNIELDTLVVTAYIVTNSGARAIGASWTMADAKPFPEN